jgi:hypothetical protein
MLFNRAVQKNAVPQTQANYYRSNVALNPIAKNKRYQTRFFTFPLKEIDSLLRNYYVTMLFCLNILTAVLLFPPQLNAEPRIVDAPESGVELGLGWDSKTGLIKPGRCVVFSPIQEGGQTTTINISEVSDSAEMANHLGVSASLSVDGIGGAGANFSRSTAVSSLSSNYSVHAVVSNGVMFAGPWRHPSERRYAFSPLDYPRIRKSDNVQPSPAEHVELDDTVLLTPWALKKLDQSSPEHKSSEFEGYCGDHFVSAIYSGVELMALFTFEAESQEAKTELGANISASYDMVSAGAGADWANSDLAKKSKLRIQYTQTGGAGGIIPTTQEALKDKLNTIAREAIDAPHFYDIAVTPYSDLPNWKWQKNETTVLPKPQKIIFQRDLELASLYAEIESVLPQIKIENPPGTVSPPPPFPAGFPAYASELRKIQGMVLRLRQTIGLLSKQIIKKNLTPAEPKIMNNTSSNIEDMPSTSDLKLLPLSSAEFKCSSNDIKKPSSVSDWVEILCKLDVLPWRLRLPLPQYMSSPVAQNWRKAVVDHFVGQRSKRICLNTPLSSMCRTSKQLKELEELVPTYTVTEGVSSRALVGYICSPGGTNNWGGQSKHIYNYGCLATGMEPDKNKVTFKAITSTDFESGNYKSFQLWRTVPVILEDKETGIFQIVKYDSPLYLTKGNTLAPKPKKPAKSHSLDPQIYSMILTDWSKLKLGKMFQIVPQSISTVGECLYHDEWNVMLFHCDVAKDSGAIGQQWFFFPVDFTSAKAK